MILLTYVFQFQSLSSIVFRTRRTNGEEATGYFWQKISPALEYALQLKFNQKKAATNFSAGVKYALDSDNSVKVRAFLSSSAHMHTADKSTWCDAQLLPLAFNITRTSFSEAASLADSLLIVECHLSLTSLCTDRFRFCK